MADAWGPLLENDPPWGAFPVEQYLIRHWDHNSEELPPEQRQRLVAEFVSLGSIPVEWDAIRNTISVDNFRTPTPDEIAELLSPWRPVMVRQIACWIWKQRQNEAIWIRTHYSANTAEREVHDTAFNERWVSYDRDTDPNFTPENIILRMLGSPYFASFFTREDESNDWDQIFEIIPELAGPREGHARVRDSYPDEDCEKIKGLQAMLRENLRQGETPAEELITQDEAAAELQALAVDSFLVIADAEAFERDQLRVLFLDTEANVVWHTRIRADKLHETRTCWRASRLRMMEAPWWNPEVGSECLLGEKYLLDGEMGRRLYKIEGTPGSEPLS